MQLPLDHRRIPPPSRTFRDAAGVEWEVYDEGGDPLAMALDWGRIPPVPFADRGPVVLVFQSRIGPRRLRNAPDDWCVLGDAELAELCERAARLWE